MEWMMAKKKRGSDVEEEEGGDARSFNF